MLKLCGSNWGNSTAKMNDEYSGIEELFEWAWDNYVEKYTGDYINRLTEAGIIGRRKAKSLIKETGYMFKGAAAGNGISAFSGVPVGDISIEKAAIRDDLRSASGTRIKGIQRTTLNNIRGILSEGFDENVGWRGIMEKVAPVIKDYNRAEMIGRTEMSWAYARNTLNCYLEAGIWYVIWDSTADFKQCEACARLNGKVFHVNDLPDLPLHPRCRCTWLPYLGKSPVDKGFMTIGTKGKGKTYPHYILNGETNEIAARELHISPESSIMNLGGGNKMFTGASGAIPRTDFKRQNQHARLFYEEVRGRTSDTYRIAVNTGFSVEDIEKIKRHIFINEYDLGEEIPSRFDPDYDMAVSWQRLTEGKTIQEMDIVMLRHELMEHELMAERGLTYREAHEITEKHHNYAEYIRELNRKAGLE